MSATDLVTLENRMPPAGANKLMQAMEDYDLVIAENASLKDQVKTFSELANKLAAEGDALRNQITVQGEFFTKQINAITAHRDRLERFAKGLTTRLKIVRECVAAAEAEAKLEAIEPKETPKVAAQAQAVDRLPTNTM